MKNLFSLIPILFCLFYIETKAQKPDYTRIDKMIIYGDYKKAADTCRLILALENMNSELWYKLGLAEQYMVPDTGSFKCFLKASEYAPENNFYRFTVAKGYLNRNKTSKAKPLLLDLCKADSSNWNYAYYLTNIYIQEGRYNEAIDVYNRFYKSDSTNYVLLDKLGFAYLKKNEFLKSIDFYNRSLAINRKNIDAIRNLSYLYPYVHKSDTAIFLLTKAISMEPDDIDLYARRATIYFSKNHNKSALNDYLKILSLGDSSTLYLKRAGIGYMNNLQPDMAVRFLLKAHVRDTTDYETLDHIAECYYRLNNHQKSEIFYEKLITLLKQFQTPLAMAYLEIAREQKTQDQFTKAVGNFSNAYKITEFPFIQIYIANIYDENLQNIPKALEYYKRFLSLFKNQKLSESGLYTASYIESINKRVEYLENKLEEEKVKSVGTTAVRNK